MFYSPHPVQAKAHKAFLVDGYDRGVLFWGRQVGKSLWSVKHLEMAACYKQGQYFIVFNTHKHAADVMWEQYLHTIPKELIYDTNKSELKIYFNYMKTAMEFPGIGWKAVKHDDTIPRSSIQLLGSDYAQDHTGRKAHGMIFDEYQDQDPTNWDTTYKPFFTTTKGWACFMGTPRGYNHWYDTIQDAKREDNKRWYYQEATWRDNPAIDPEWIKAEREEAERLGTLDSFLQEYELQFRTTQGSVYGSFDRKIHVITPSDKRLPLEPTIYGVWDFGYAEGHPMAFNFVEIDGQGTWFVTDEIHGTGIDMETMIEQIRVKQAGRKLSGIIADSARPDLIELARSKGLNVIPSPKRQGSVQSGITLLSHRIQPKIQLTGMPEPAIYFTENCKKTIYQMENYKWKEPKENRPTSDVPVKKDDDHPDALRYLALYLKYGLVEKRQPIKISLPMNRYGLPK